MKGTNTVIAPGGFHHLALKAKDFDASSRFYTQVLGFRPVLNWGQGNSRAVMLDAGDGACLEIFAGGPEKPAPEGALLHFALNCKDPDGAIARVRAAGVEITMEPKTLDIPSQPPATVRIAFCKGPDGEVIEFFHRIK